MSIIFHIFSFELLNAVHYITDYVIKSIMLMQIKYVSNDENNLLCLYTFKWEFCQSIVI